MTKEEFTNLKITEIKCRMCERLLPNINFTYNSMHVDNTGICRSCQWIKNNKSKVDKLKEKYDETLLVEIVHFIFESENNDLCIISNSKQIPLDEVIDIVIKLNIGNKKFIVKTECEYCGKIAEYSPSAYKNRKHHYCSHECYYKDKSRITPRGENSIFYNRVETRCSNCNKLISVTPSHYDKINRFGDNHNFCSNKCYWQYRSGYYVGEKSNKDLINWTTELINKMRINKIKSMASDDRLNTKPQKIVNDILNNMDLSYIREYNTKYYSIDNYLNDNQLMIEVMGDYWHANPIKYNEKYGLNEKQLNGIHRDKLKYSYIKNHYNIDILYLWETDIIKNPLLCKKLIEKYIESNGILENYNSFNYSLNGNSLVLNQNIIIPYKDMEKTEYKKFLKNKAS